MSSKLMKMQLELEIDGDKAVVVGLDRISASTKGVTQSSGRMGAASSNTAKGLGRMAAGSDEAARGLGRMAASSQRSTRELGNLKNVIAAVGVAYVFKQIISATKEQEAAEAQLTAVLKSTQQAAGLSAAALKTHAASLQETTIYGDEATIAMQAVLLTFKEVKGDNFTRATADVLDMATALNMDLKSAAIMVGKALNDPAQGLTAMSRAGITFTDQQKEQVKQMQATNDMAGAQALIMSELESQFGGSAAAARDTFGGALTAVQNNFSDLLEAKGGLNDAKDGLEDLATLLADESMATAANTLTSALIAGFSGSAQILVKMSEAVDGWKIMATQAAGIFDRMGIWLTEDEGSDAYERGMAASYAAEASAIDDIMAKYVDKGVAAGAAARKSVAASDKVISASEEELEPLRTMGIIYGELIGQAGQWELAAGRAIAAKKREADAYKEATAAIIAYNNEKYKGDTQAGKDTPDDPWMTGAYEDGMAAANKRAAEYLGHLKSINSAHKDNTTEILNGLSVSQEAFGKESKGQAALQVAIQATNLVRAIGAVINQGSGDPYTAFARMAAMAGAMAALGQSVGSIGGGFSDTAARRQAEQGTGSVLGDATAKSESILNATEITAGATSELVGINRGMLTALEALQVGIDGAVTLIARGANNIDFSAGFDRITSSIDNGKNNIRGAFDPRYALSDAMGFNPGGAVGEAVDFATFGTDVVGRWLGDLLGGSSKVTDEGIKIMGGAMTDILDGALVSAYSEMQYKKFAWGDTHTKEFSQNLAPEASQQFTLVFQSIADSVTAGALALGLSATEIDTAMEAFTVETLTISLKDLDPAEQAAELEAVFGTLFDDLSLGIVPFINDFTVEGEGFGETLVRVATSVQVTEEATKRLGFTAKRLGVEQFATLSTALMEAAGGLDEFINGMNNFFATFAPAAVQFGTLQEDLTTALDAVGLALPATAEDMWQLMQSLEAGTEAGDMQIATLLRLTDSSKEYYSGVEDASEKALAASKKYWSDITDFVEAFSGADPSVALTSKITEAFAAYGAEVPATRQELYDLGVTLYNMGDAGADARDALLELTPELSRYYDTLEAGQIEAAATAEQAASDLAAIQQEASDAALRAETELAAARERIANERSGLERQLLQLQGNTNALRALELAALDPSNRALQEQIWTLEDAKTAADGYTAAQKDASGALEAAAKDLESAQRAYDAALLGQQRDALQAVYDVQKAWADMAETLRGTLRDLMGGELSTLSPEHKLAAAQQQYQTTLASAQGGDVGAAQALSGYAKDYASQARDYYASGSQYSGIFASITSELGAVAGLADSRGSTADLTLAQLEALNGTSVDAVAAAATALAQAQQAYDAALKANDLIKSQSRWVQETQWPEQQASDQQQTTIISTQLEKQVAANVEARVTARDNLIEMKQTNAYLRQQVGLIKNEIGVLREGFTQLIVRADINNELTNEGVQNSKLEATAV